MEPARAYTPPERRATVQRSAFSPRHRLAVVKGSEPAGPVSRSAVAEMEPVPAPVPANEQRYVPAMELVELQERMRKTEEAWIEQKLKEQAVEQRRQAEVTERRIADMVADVTSELTAITRRQATELRRSRRAAQQWKTGGVALAILFFACIVLYLATPFFVKPNASPAPVATTSASRVRVLPNPADLRRNDQVADPAADPAASADETLTAHSLDRLERVLERIPSSELDDVMHAANQWLIASGRAPCTVQSTHGDASLLVTVNRRGLTPLGAAFSHCADAVEHVIE